MRQRTYIMGVVFIVLIFIGYIFKSLHIPGAAMMLVIGMILFSLVFTVSYTIDKVSLERRQIAKLAQVILSIAMVLIISGTLFTIMRYPGGKFLAPAGVLVFCIYLVFFTRHTEGRKLIMQKDRQLACILFTDIVGFTSMMGKDEDKTLLILDRNRKIQKKHIRRYRGKWIKEMGDGAIAIFYTASEAIQCAIDIQKEVQEKESFSLSMGLHISEILFTEKDVFGDGVNVASRIVSLAGANEICFSDIVYQNIRNREDIKVESLGNQNLKNVAYVVEAYKILV